MSVCALILNHILDMDLSKEDRVLIAAYLNHQLDDLELAAFNLRLIEEPELKNALLVEAAILNSVNESQKEQFESLFEQAEENIILDQFIKSTVHENEQTKFETLFEEAWEAAEKPSKKPIAIRAMITAVAASLLFLFFIPFTSKEQQKEAVFAEASLIQNIESPAQLDSISIRTNSLNHPNRSRIIEAQATPIEPVYTEPLPINLAQCSETRFQQALQCVGLSDTDIHLYLQPQINSNSETYEEQLGINTCDMNGNPIALSLEPIPNDYDNLSTQFATLTEVKYRIRQEYKGTTTYHYIKELRQDGQKFVAIFEIAPTASRLDWLIFDS